MKLSILNIVLFLQLVFECAAFTLGVTSLRPRIAAQTLRKVPVLYSDAASSTNPNAPEEAAAAIPGSIASA